MAKTAPRGRFGPALFGSALIFGAMLAVGCGPPVPASPSFEADVRPIFISHCVRCHGAGPDGGAINHATQPTGPDAAYLASDPGSPAPFYFDLYNPPGRAGAYACATAEPAYLTMKIHGGVLPMPPAPAPLLDDWELKVVDAWIANPICSNAAHPDPTICPSDAGQ